MTRRLAVTSKQASKQNRYPPTADLLTYPLNRYTGRQAARLHLLGADRCLHGCDPGAAGRVQSEAVGGIGAARRALCVGTQLAV